MSCPTEIKIQDEVYVKKSSLEKPKQAVMDGMKFVIVRCQKAGVHAGYHDNDNSDIKGTIKLINSRRLYYWWCKNGATLSELSQNGIPESKMDRVKFSMVLPELYIPLSDIGEINPCTSNVAKQIYEVKIWNPQK